MPDKDTAPVVNEVKDRRTVTISKSNGSFGLKVGEGSNGHVRVFGVVVLEVLCRYNILITALDPGWSCRKTRNCVSWRPNSGSRWSSIEKS